MGIPIEALVVEEAGGPFLEKSLTLDEPGPGEVLVKILATGICHTDLAIVNQRVPFPLPAVLGHEGSGYVVKAGPGVDHVKEGDPVVLSFDHCGGCVNCSNHHEAYCHEFFALNLKGCRRDGSSPISNGKPVGSMFFGQSSFATHAIASARSVVKVRADAPLELLGPLGCGVQTGAGAMLNVLKPAPNSVVAITGTGGVGLSAVMAAKVLGCETIIAVDKAQSRLTLAAQLGASHTVDAADKSLSEVCSELGGADVVFDTTGSPEVAKEAIGLLRPNGVFSFVGGAKAEDTITVAMPYLVAGRKIMGISEGDSTPSKFIPELVDLFMDGKFPFDQLVKFYDASEINDAVADTLSGKAVKPIIRMTV